MYNTQNPTQNGQPNQNQMSQQGGPPGYTPQQAPAYIQEGQGPTHAPQAPGSTVNSQYTQPQQGQQQPPAYAQQGQPQQGQVVHHVHHQAPAVDPYSTGCKKCMVIGCWIGWILSLLFSIAASTAKGKGMYEGYKSSYSTSYAKIYYYVGWESVDGNELFMEKANIDSEGKQNYIFLVLCIILNLVILITIPLHYFHIRINMREYEKMFYWGQLPIMVAIWAFNTGGWGTFLKALKDSVLLDELNEWYPVWASYLQYFNTIFIIIWICLYYCYCQC